jgi:hypothetical protein
MKSTLTEPRIHDDLAEFYSLWRDACLGRKASETDEIKFLLDMLASSSNSKSIIDLGGSVGLHAIALTKHSFDVTLLDKASTALAIAKRTCPQLKIVQSSFESISLSQNFDASFCMLSSLSYLLEEPAREAFYNWIKTHINDLAVFDQINPLRLPRTYSDNCQSEDKHFRFNVLREWHFEEDLLHTSFVYEFVDKASEATKIINDSQVQKFLTVEELIKYMGKQWRVIALLGDCNLKQPFDQENSPRMIAVFKKQHS